MLRTKRKTKATAKRSVRSALQAARTNSHRERELFVRGPPLLVGCPARCSGRACCCDVVRSNDRSRGGCKGMRMRGLLRADCRSESLNCRAQPRLLLAGQGRDPSGPCPAACHFMHGELGCPKRGCCCCEPRRSVQGPRAVERSSGSRWGRQHCSSTLLEPEAASKWLGGKDWGPAGLLSSPSAVGRAGCGSTVPPRRRSAASARAAALLPAGAGPHQPAPTRSRHATSPASARARSWPTTLVQGLLGARGSLSPLGQQPCLPGAAWGCDRA